MSMFTSFFLLNDFIPGGFSGLAFGTHEIQFVTELAHLDVLLPGDMQIGPHLASQIDFLLLCHWNNSFDLVAPAGLEPATNGFVPL